ncbi:NAD(P)-dependent oxidoreductase [Microbacterium aerolatum]|uniref:3-hydroxyisobutyrate dehydrogenase n=1 Tax=Microbacterium aerolatum TaxID=153731 RepID=A0A511AE59_9MICO|nr:NAD(P)-dependent oxidoreductase [Microbacterium aerolatum]GEK86409.1 3-hydroxyisobutyrate dehydrogenase [Microbacterium aerolatum]GGB22643.1 3-hydroxyisobutyrate dehydrogenase [Microbacterium aerolatum]
MRIAWIGLGNMGSPMSANLAAAGHEVVGFDVSEAAMSAAAERGVARTASVADAVRDADIIFTMLPNGKLVLDVADGPEGVLANAGKDAIFIDSSTIDVETTTRLSDLSKDRGLRFVDAPVSGGVPGAVAGSLTFMIGGAEEDIASIRPIIEVLAGRIFHIGPVGQGQAAKIVNNTIAGMNLAAMCEGAVLAERLGINAKTFHDLATVSTGDSWALRMTYPIAGVVEGAAVNNDFKPGFAASLMAKDVGLGVTAASAVGLDVPLAEVALAQLNELLTRGMGHLDCSALVKVVEGSIDAESA